MQPDLRDLQVRLGTPRALCGEHASGAGADVEVASSDAHDHQLLQVLVTLHVRRRRVSALRQRDETSQRRSLHVDLLGQGVS
eukprot:756256-Hanusia_phi.AAC.2